MAQLGDLVRAKALLRRAARAFGPREAVARARCVVAEAEIALVSRDLGWPAKALDAARATLAWYRRSPERRACASPRGAAPPPNRAHRRGRAERSPASIPRRFLRRPGPPTNWQWRGSRCDARTGLRTKTARAALGRARHAARLARIPALAAEVEGAFLVLNTPAARLIARGEEQLLLLEGVETLLQSNAFIVDACRHAVRDKRTVVSLVRRPVLFTIARALGEAWPDDVSRDALVARAFGAKRADESHRARLRVEVGRLRTALRTMADVRATRRGFVLATAARTRGRRAGATHRRGARGGACFPGRW